MRNLKLESSTDSEFAQRAAQTQPYNVVEVVIATARPSIQREDGSTEHAPDDVQTLSALVPGRELQENMLAYSKRVEEFKKEHPELEFDRYVGQDVAIPIIVRDEVMRYANGPEIARFLAEADDVRENLCRMRALDAAKCIESMSEDFERLAVPREEMDQVSWKAARNLVKKTARARKR